LSRNAGVHSTQCLHLIPCKRLCANPHKQKILTLDAQAAEVSVELSKSEGISLSGNTLEVFSTLGGHHRVLLNHHLNVVLQELVGAETLTRLR
jgi:hypothetical protein